MLEEKACLTFSMLGDFASTSSPCVAGRSKLKVSLQTNKNVRRSNPVQHTAKYVSVPLSIVDLSARSFLIFLTARDRRLKKMSAKKRNAKPRTLKVMSLIAELETPITIGARDSHIVLDMLSSRRKSAPKMQVTTGSNALVVTLKLTEQ